MSLNGDPLPKIGMRGRAHTTFGADDNALRALDLTGRERQLRAAMQAMAQVANRFSRASRRTLPFLIRHHSRLVPQPVSIINPADALASGGGGPTFEVLLEAEELPAWASVTIGPNALRVLLEGSLGAKDPTAGELGEELTLAQRAVIARVARSLAEDFVSAVREQVGLTFGIVSAQARAASEGVEPPGLDGLHVDCILENLPGDPYISIAVSAEALETAAREQREDAPASADPRMAEALREVSVAVTAELGSTRLGVREVLNLKVGQVIRLNVAIDDPVLVRIEGLGKFVGRPVVSRGQLAVEIRGRVDG